MPTPRQIQIHDAVVEHGTYALAAKSLDLTPGAIYSGMNAYNRAMGVDAGPRRVGGASAVARARQAAIQATPERLEALELRVGELVRISERLLERTERFDELLTAFCARQPVVLAPARDSLQPTHRRIADGGQGGRREARG